MNILLFDVDVLSRGVISSATGGSELPPRGNCPLIHRHTAVGHSKAVLAVFATDSMLYSASKGIKIYLKK